MCELLCEQLYLVNEYSCARLNTIQYVSYSNPASSKHFADFLTVCLRVKQRVITINVPLILKVRDIIFLSGAKHIMGHFAGFFEGAETFLTPKLS
jgi:hypothetical protein